MTDFQYLGEDPYSKNIGELKIGPKGARFVLPREKKTRSYKAQFDLEWSEVLCFECCEVNYCHDYKSWPLHEEPPSGYEIIGPAGMFFVNLLLNGEAQFQIWAYIPRDDVANLRELAEGYLGIPSLPGIAHHGTAAAIRYIVENCEVLSRFETDWVDWTHKSPNAPMTKPRDKLREKGPVYSFCKEGMGIDFYGAGEQLEQMSTFWPWRLIKAIYLEDVEIIYLWHEDSYTFRQQVWEQEPRQSILDAANSALSTYRSSSDVRQVLLIRPWSFPSSLHRTWDQLEPFNCKASRNRFPPIYDFEEDDD